MEKGLGYWEERYAILLEVRRGTTACTMIVHNLLHFKEDTRNFSGQDNYSCWNKEIAVSRYVHHPNNHKNIEHTFANTEELREALKFRKEPKEQRPDPQKTDPNKPWAKSIEQAQKLYCTHQEVHLQADLTGCILVGGVHYLTLDARVRHTIANEQCVPIEDIKDDATCYRSVWFPSHCYDGLLYRENEHAVIITQDGETIVKLLDLLCVFASDEWKLFLRAKKFEEQNFSSNGMKVVTQMDNDTVSPIGNISRKVMLSPHETDESGNPLYTVIIIDFMRRIFPTSAGIVVVPYYPVKNDLILVRGDDEDSLGKALVLSFSMRQKTVCVKCLKSDRIWIPENSPVQDIHLNIVSLELTLMVTGSLATLLGRNFSVNVSSNIIACVDRPDRDVSVAFIFPCSITFILLCFCGMR